MLQKADTGTLFVSEAVMSTHGQQVPCQDQDSLRLSSKCQGSNYLTGLVCVPALLGSKKRSVNPHHEATIVTYVLCGLRPAQQAGILHSRVMSHHSSDTESKVVSHQSLDSVSDRISEFHSCDPVSGGVLP